MMRKLRALILPTLVLALGFSPAAASPILNTLQLGQADDTGWSGVLEGMLRAGGGNSEKFQVEAGARLQRQTDRHRLRLISSGSYEEVAGVEKSREVTAHLRHNYDLGRGLATVSFTQIQHNPFQRLQSRWLLGAGIRWNVLDEGSGRVAIGATPMLEVERIEDRDGKLGRGRLSTFLVTSLTLKPGVVCEASGFYQPLFGDFSQVRAVGNLGITVALSGSLSLKTGASVEHNSDPPAGVKRTDWSTYTGLGWKF
ncbi:MAG: YdiY family protein [Candidatus Krumholzibacteriia bacterium]